MQQEHRDFNIIGNLIERVAVLEQQLEDIAEIKSKINTIHDELTRYKGILGAFAFLGSCFAVLVTILKDWFFRHWN